MLRAIKADAFWAFGVEGLRHLAADADCDGWLAALAGIIEVTSQPAVFFEPVGITRSLPDFGGAKMRTVRIGIADALDNGKLAGVIQFFEAGQARIQTDLVVEWQDRLFRKTYFVARAL